MIRAFAWGWLFWRHRAAVRRGWRWGQGKDRLAHFDALIRTHFVEHLRAAMEAPSPMLWDDDQVHRDVHNEWYIPVVQSDPSAIVTDR